MVYGNSVQKLEEILFEHKNKTFGAYYLRKNKKNYILIGFLHAILATFIFTLQVFFKKWISNSDSNTDTKSVVVNIINFEELAPPPSIERPNIQINKVAYNSNVRFTEPIIKKDELVRDMSLPPTQSELKTYNPGLQDFKGNDSLHYSGNLVPIFSNDSNKENDSEKHKPKLPDKDKEEEVFHIVEKMPMFPGGEIEMLKFLANNIQYPKEAIQLGIEGKVFIQFTVDKNGNIKDAKVVKGIGGGCENEALRVINMMPAWEPGMINNKAVSVKFVIPITFKITEQ
jgi:protein TonB